MLGEQAPAAESYKSVAEGAATSVWAATDLALTNYGCNYLEDCHIAPVIQRPNHKFGVMDYALDAESAECLWHQAEVFLERPLPP